MQVYTDKPECQAEMLFQQVAADLRLLPPAARVRALVQAAEWDRDAVTAECESCHACRPTTWHNGRPICDVCAVLPPSELEANLDVPF